MKNTNLIVIPPKIFVSLDSLKKEINGIVIKDAETANQAGVYTANIKRLNRFLSDLLAERVKPLEDEKKALQGQIKPYLDQLKAGEAVLKAKILEYSKIEAELREKSRQEALKNIDPFDTTTDLTEFNKKKISNTSIRRTRDIEVVDESKIPREYMMPNLKKIKADMLRAVKPVKIDGVKIIYKENVATRI